jgi:hypothetical protein
MPDRTLFAPAHLAASGGDGPLEFTISTGRLNRYGFKLTPSRWRLDNFAANPVVLWMHNPMVPPVGRAQARGMAREVRASVVFDTDDELGATLDRKYRAGFLNAVSVGFGFTDDQGAPVEWWNLSAEQIATEVFYDLEELSAVTVPADPGALKRMAALAVALGADDLAGELANLDRLDGRPPLVPFTEPTDLARAELKAELLEELRAELGLAPGAPVPTPPPPVEPSDVVLDSAAVEGLLAAFSL